MDAKLLKLRLYNALYRLGDGGDVNNESTDLNKIIKDFQEYIEYTEHVLMNIQALLFKTGQQCADEDKEHLTPFQNKYIVNLDREDCYLLICRVKDLLTDPFKPDGRPAEQEIDRERDLTKMTADELKELTFGKKDNE